jgi:phage protein D
MDLVTLSDQYGAFYVPAFVVRVNGKSLTDDLAIAVSQVEVDLSLGAAGRFSFTVVDTFDLEKATFLSAYGEPVLETLTFGAAIQIGIGYGDRARLRPFISGMITEITTGFAEGGTPELAIAGYDYLFAMTLGKVSKSWSQASDSDVVTELAKRINLGTGNIQSTPDKRPQIEQNQESDFEFIKKLAERNHYEFYVDADNNLRFGKPRDASDGVIALRWGQSLLSFKPEANLANQVSSVEVYGWDPGTKDKIVGRAHAGDETGHDPQRTSGGQHVNSAPFSSPVLQIRQPVFTQAEADERAKAILNDHAKKFVTGEAECVGVPDLRPDGNVRLENLGSPFTKTYYIEQATHKVDGNGYRTRVKVKETTL